MPLNEELDEIKAILSVIKHVCVRGTNELEQKTIFDLGYLISILERKIETIGKYCDIAGSMVYRFQRENAEIN